MNWYRNGGEIRISNFEFRNLNSDRGAVPYSDQSVSIHAIDFDHYVEARDVQKIEYDGNADLVKAAVRRYSSKGERLISLPLCTRHEFEDLEYVVAVLRQVLDSGAAKKQEEIGNSSTEHQEVKEQC